MTSFDGLMERARQIAHEANSYGANVTVQGAVEDGEVQLIFSGTNTQGRKLVHPLSCGHLCFPEYQLENEDFIYGMLDAVEATLHARELTEEQKFYLPPAEELITELLNMIFGDTVGIGISIFVVREADIDNSDIPQHIRDILRDAKRNRRTKYTPRNGEKDHLN